MMINVREEIDKYAIEFIKNINSDHEKKGLRASGEEFVEGIKAMLEGYIKALYDEAVQIEADVAEGHLTPKEVSEKINRRIEISYDIKSLENALAATTHTNNVLAKSLE